jgi:hypothetical protein
VSARALGSLLLLYGGSCASAPDPELRSIHTGMTLGQIEARILDHHGRRMETVYHFPWADLESDLAGYHVHYELADRTLLQCRVQSRPSEATREWDYEVIRFELGLRGKNYPGKMEWFEESRSGKHDFPMKLDLADFVDVSPSPSPR